MPARASSFCVAGIGPSPISFGSTPAARRRDEPRQRLPASAPPARSRDASSTAAAPSLSPDALPAVTVPPCLRNAGRSAASSAAVVSGRGCSSVSNVRSAPFACGTSTGTSSAAKRPAACAAAQRRWLSSANASCASRVTPYFSATSSAVSPSGCVPCSASIFGFTNRQPSVLSCMVTSPRGNASLALAITSGARDIDSTPPAITSSASPAAMARAPAITASRPEPHSRLTVAPGTPTGSPASSRLMRATLRLSSPAWLAQPKITSSIAAGSTPGAPHERADGDRAQIVRAAPRPARRGTARPACEPRRRSERRVWGGQASAPRSY